MKKADIEYAIAEKEGIELTADTETVFDETAKPEAQPVDNATMIAMMAAQMAKEATEKMAQLSAQATLGKKVSPPEEVVDKQHRTDKAVIAGMEKVSIYIPGGYPGAPKAITSCVNGHRIAIKVGATVMVPRPHAENIQMTWKEKQKNMDKQEAESRKATEA